MFCVHKRKFHPNLMHLAACLLLDTLDANDGMYYGTMRSHILNYESALIEYLVLWQDMCPE